MGWAVMMRPDVAQGNGGRQQMEGRAFILDKRLGGGLRRPALWSLST